MAVRDLERPKLAKKVILVLQFVDLAAKRVSTKDISMHRKQGLLVYMPFYFS
jgi:hypothetical protein